MKLKTFTIRDREFKPLHVNVQYRPLVVNVGGVTHELAVHRYPARIAPRTAPWTVSDPVSGAAVVHLRSFYKGCPVQSGGMTVAQAMAEAKAQVQSLIERQGDRFNKVLADAAAKVAELTADEDATV